MKGPHHLVLPETGELLCVRLCRLSASCACENEPKQVNCHLSTFDHWGGFQKMT